MPKSTWIDPETNLEWQMLSPGKMNWHQAMQYAEVLELNAKKDWRLPSIMELESLLDRSAMYEKMRPEMRQDVPFKDNSAYWSCTTFGHNTSSAWIMFFDGGYILSYDKNNLYSIRLVRG